MEIISFLKWIDKNPDMKPSCFAKNSDYWDAVKAAVKEGYIEQNSVLEIDVGCGECILQTQEARLTRKARELIDD